MTDLFEGEASLGPCAVIRQSLEAWDFLKVAEVLAECLGLNVLDARQLARRAPGILAERLPESQAERLAQELQALGVSSILAPSDQLMPLPREFQSRSLEISPGHFVFRGEDDRKAVEMRPENVFALCVAQLHREQEMTTVNDSVGYAYAAGMGRMRMQPTHFTSTSTKETWPYALCVFRVDEPTQIRIYSDKFNYKCLGDDIRERSENAFRELLQKLASLCPDASVNDGVPTVIQGEKLDKGLQFDREREFEEYAHWFLQVALAR